MIQVANSDKWIWDGEMIFWPNPTKNIEMEDSNNKNNEVFK